MSNNKLFFFSVVEKGHAFDLPRPSPFRFFCPLLLVSVLSQFKETEGHVRYRCGLHLAIVVVAVLVISMIHVRWANTISLRMGVGFLGRPDNTVTR